MDVRAAIRRTRLPFVASLLLAALLGAPATVEPAPAPGPAVISAAASTATTPADTPAAEPDTEPAPATVVAESGDHVPAARPGLLDRAARAALAPRAPPAV